MNILNKYLAFIHHKLNFLETLEYWQIEQKKKDCNYWLKIVFHILSGQFLLFIRNEKNS